MNRVVVVGMSAREVASGSVLAELAAPHDAALAFLQVGDPSLVSVLDDVAASGATEVTVVGVSLGPLAPGISWLRRIVAHWVREHPAPPEVTVGTRLVAFPEELATLLARELPGAMGGGVRGITGTEPGLRSPSWDAVPGHRHQVLVCRGVRCSAQGSDRVAAALGDELNATGQGDDDVLVTMTGCQFPCNHAPVVVVQPDDVWYGGVDDDGVRRITHDHLIGGLPVPDLRLPRTRRAQRPLEREL